MLQTTSRSAIALIDVVKVVWLFKNTTIVFCKITKYCNLQAALFRNFGSPWDFLIMAYIIRKRH